MKLGLLTAPFEDTPLEEVADWTAANGFTTIEIACWPASSGDRRRYAGTSHIDVDGISDAQASEIADSMDQKGLEISGLGYYPNPLHPDPEHSRMVIDHLKKVIVAAGKMNVGIVNLFQHTANRACGLKMSQRFRRVVVEDLDPSANQRLDGIEKQLEGAAKLLLFGMYQPAAEFGGCLETVDFGFCPRAEGI